MKANELMIGDFVTRQNYENKAVIDVCCSLLEFKRMPKKYFENYSLAELDLEE